MHCTAYIAFGTHTKTASLKRSRYRFGEESGGPKESYINRGCRSPIRGKRQFGGLFRPFKSMDNLRCSRCCSVAVAFAAKRTIHSPITLCSRSDNSVCQTSANSILKMSGRRCGLSAANVVVGLHSAGEV